MGQLFGVQAVEMVILALGRDKAAVHTLLLKTQHHHHINVAQPFFHVFINFTAKFSECRGHKRRWADQTDAVFHLVQQQHVRPRHTAVCDVAANGDVQAVQTALGAADGQGIQQRLRGVFVAPVTGIQHGAVHLLAQQVDGA